MQVPPNNLSNTPYGGAAVGSPGYSGSLQTVDGARTVQVKSTTSSKEFDPVGYTTLCAIRNGILATPDKRFADLLSQYKKTGILTLTSQDPQNYRAAILKAAPLAQRIMVATPEQWKQLQNRVVVNE